MNPELYSSGYAKSAIISPCKQYRYTLGRSWSLPGCRGSVLWVMLNPSTADGLEDDPTIRRCIDFAERWGYAGIMVGNLYDYRTPSPAELKGAGYPISAECNAQLEAMAARAQLIVAAWGSHAQPHRAREVLEILRAWRPVHCMGRTRAGMPKHPLYLPSATISELLCDMVFRP